MKTRYLTIGVDRTVVAYTEDPVRMVTIMLDLPEDQTGFAPDLGLAIQLSPAEARGIAQALIRKADDVESRKPLLQ